MRVLHTSDWHLGKRLMERSLLEEQRHALDALRALLASEPHDLLVIAGDVFDQSVPPEEAVELLGEFLHGLRLSLPSLPVVIIAGNHDSAARLACHGELLRSTRVYLCGEAEGVARPIVVTTSLGERAEVWGVPFLWAGALAEDGVVAQSQVEAMTFALNRIRAQQSPDHTQILVAHCFAQGGSSTDSERSLVGQATLVEPSVFAGFDYVALGHLHRPQQVADNTRYSGSLLQYSFSEAADDKCVLSVEVTAQAPHVATQKRLPARRRLRRVEGTMKELLESDQFAPFVDDFLHITLTEPQHAGQPMASLRKRFPHALQLVNPVIEQLVAPASMPKNTPGQDVEVDFAAFVATLYGERDTTALREAWERIRRAPEANR